MKAFMQLQVVLCALLLGGGVLCVEGVVFQVPVKGGDPLTFLSAAPVSCPVTTTCTASVWAVSSSNTLPAAIDVDRCINPSVPLRMLFTLGTGDDIFLDRMNESTPLFLTLESRVRFVGPLLEHAQVDLAGLSAATTGTALGTVQSSLVMCSPSSACAFNTNYTIQPTRVDFGVTKGSIIASALGFEFAFRGVGCSGNVDSRAELMSASLSVVAQPDVRVTSVSPTQSIFNTSLAIDIEGQNFYNTSDWSVRLSQGGTFVFLNCPTAGPTTIDCAALSAPLALGDWFVAVSPGGSTYTDDPVKISIVEQLSPNTTTISGAASGTPNPLEGSSSEGAASDSNELTLILVVVGILVFCLILLIIAFIIVRRNRKRGGNIVERLMPKREFEPILFPEDKQKPEFDFDKDAERLAAEVLEVIRTPPDFAVGVALADSVDVAERDRLSKSLVYVTGDECLGLLIKLAEAEVESSQGATTLFRTDCMTSKVWKTFAQIHGVAYLYDALARFVNELQASVVENDDSTRGNRDSAASSLMNMSTEIDPNRMTENDDEFINKLQLSLVCQKAFKAIQQSVTTLPPTFVAFFSTVRRLSTEKYDEATGRKAVGGFLFLRFVCPALMTPHIYGLTREPPQSGFQRQLILIAKILQSLANDVEMGKKEPWMAPMQDIMRDNKPKFEALFDEVSGMTEAECDAVDATMPYEIPEQMIDNSAITIHNLLCIEKGKLSSSLDADTMAKVDALCAQDAPSKV